MTFETHTGRQVIPDLPDPDELEPWPPIKAAVEEHRRLRRLHREAGEKLDELIRQRAAAAEEDTRAYARAIRQRKGDPGDQAVKSLEEETRAARRRFDALGVAIEGAGRDLVAILEEHRAAALADSDALIETDAAEYRAALERIAEVRGRIVARTGLRRWLAQFPERLKYRAASRPFVADLIDGRNGEPLTFDRVLAALEADAAPQNGREAE